MRNRLGLQPAAPDGAPLRLEWGSRVDSLASIAPFIRRFDGARIEGRGGGGRGGGIDWINPFKFHKALRRNSRLHRSRVDAD